MRKTKGEKKFMQKVMFIRNDAAVVKFSKISELIIEHDVIFASGYEEVVEGKEFEERKYVGRVSELQKVITIEERSK